MTSDIIKIGGDEALNQITKIFNDILKSRKIPPEWNIKKLPSRRRRLCVSAG